MFSTVLYNSRIDFNEVLQVVQSKNESQIKDYLLKFGSGLVEHIRVDYSNLAGVDAGQIFHEIMCQILRYVEFGNQSDILPSLDSAYETAIQFKHLGAFANERMASNFSNHIRKLSPSAVSSFFEKKQTTVPFMFGFTFFADQYYKVCNSHKKPILDDDLKALSAVLDDNWSIYMLFLALQLVDDRDALLFVLKENLIHPGSDGWGMVQSLLTPEYSDTENGEHENKHVDAYQNFLWILEKNLEPHYCDVKRVLEELLEVQQSIFSYFREYQVMLGGYLSIIPMVVFYQRLKEFDCMYASAIRKLIEAKHLPGMSSRPFKTIEEFCGYFTEPERKWLAKWDMTLCSFELQYYACDYTQKELRMRLIDLLCSVGNETSSFDEFNLLEKPDFDDDGEQTNDIKGHLNVADYIKDTLYDRVPVQQIRSAYYVVYRWLFAHRQNTLSEEWESSPTPATMDPFRIAYFYDEIIDDILHHARYKDMEIAAKLTDIIYLQLSSAPYAVSMTLKFFSAYFSANEDHAIALYQEVINSQSGYSNSAASNLALIYIDRQEFALAQETIEKIPDGEKKVARQNLLDDRLKKAAKVQSILAIPKNELQLSEVSNLHLLYLTAAVSMAQANNDNCIRHRRNPVTSLLVPYYHTSHLIIRELMKAEVLRFKGDGLADFDPETANQYSLTSLPLIPNIQGYFNIDIFLEVLRDEIKRREFEPAIVSVCENHLKVAWLLNSFYYALSKNFDADDVLLNSGDYEDITTLVERFTTSQLCSMAYNAIVFVSGSMVTHGFGERIACERFLPRLFKSLKEYSHTDFKGTTYGRPRIKAFHLERILSWVDGVLPEDRFS